jgi:hypothetical protein
MTAAVWTLIALLGTALAVLVGAFFRLGSKIDAQGRELGARIDAQGRELGARIDAQGRELGARIDAQGRNLGARIDAQTGRIDALSARMDSHLERHAPPA